MSETPKLPLAEWRRLARDRLSDPAFWVLATIILVNLHWVHFWGMPMLRTAGYAVIAAACLAVLASTDSRWWKNPGTPAVLIFATAGTNLIFGGGALLAGADWQPQAGVGRDLLRQVFFLVVLMATAIGGCAILARTGTEAMLKGILAILITSCLVIMLTPILRDVGVLTPYRLPYRLAGAHTDPNDAGLVGCATTVLALALLCNGGPRKLAYLGIAAGYFAVLASFSKAASLSLVAVSIFFLLTHSLGRRHPVLRLLPVLYLGALAVHLDLGGHLHKIHLYPDHTLGDFCPTVSPSNPGLKHDCTTLLAVRDTLAGDAEINWDASVPITLWQGVVVKQRVVALDLSNLNLTGRIPSELGRLDQLAALRLNHIWLTGTVSDMLGNLAHHTELRTEGNLLITAPAETAEDPPDFGILESGRNVKLTIDGEKLNYGLMARRPDLWKRGLAKIREAPLLGHGIGAMHSLEGAAVNQDGKSAGVHNLYLMLIGEAGIVPLSLYCLFLLSLLRLLWTAPCSLARDASVGVAGVMTLYGMIFHHLLTNGVFIFLAGLSCAMATACWTLPSMRAPQSVPENPAA